jgi:TrmH family RNA methyltransferase
MISVIFIEPESPGNIGSLARVMANFGLKDLILVDGCDLTEETKAMSVHAFNIADNARRVKNFKTVAKEFDVVIGTTAKIHPVYSSVRQYMTPDKLSSKLGKKTAIVFGREGIGLKNEELKLCDIIVHIPTHKNYSALNITHAAAIIFYELLGTSTEKGQAGREQRDVLLRYFESSLRKTKGAKAIGHTVHVFRNIVNRSGLAKQEADVLIGAFRNLGKTSKKEKVYK